MNTIFFFYIKSLGKSFWLLLLFLPIILIFCRPLSAVLSVCASLHIASSLQILLFQSLPFSCLSQSPSLHPSVSAVFNQKLYQKPFHPVGSVGKYNVTNSVTDMHTGVLRQNRDTCTRIAHLVKCGLWSRRYSIRGCWMHLKNPHLHANWKKRGTDCEK